MGMLKNTVMAITTRPALSPEPDESPSARGAESEFASCEFIAMEYYGLILNRTYFIAAARESISGVKVGGLVVNPPMARQEWFNPRHYLGHADLNLVHGLLRQSRTELRSEHALFNYPWSTVARITFSSESKWGMGNVPYSGRLFVALTDGRQREFILLGTQNGPNLLKHLNEIRSAAL
jgi:hypothetical protein